MIKSMGFIEPAKIGPIWARKVTLGKPASLHSEFERLLRKDFSHLMSAHGEPLLNTAKQALRHSFDATFGLGRRW
jgi:hypothetical protein